MSNDDLANLIVKTSYAVASYMTFLVETQMPVEKREEIRKLSMELWDDTFNAYMRGKCD